MDSVRFISKCISERFSTRGHVLKDEFLNYMVFLMKIIANDLKLEVSESYLKTIYGSYVQDHVCPYCGLVILSKFFEHIATHQQIHLYDCKYCDQVFHTYVSARRHYKRFHHNMPICKIEPNAKPSTFFKINKLGYGAVNKLACTIAKRTCYKCLKFSKTNSNAIAHDKTHK